MNTTRKFSAPTALALAAAALLAACGGGGGGTTAPAPPPPAPAPAPAPGPAPGPAPAPAPPPAAAACAAQTLTYATCSYSAPALASGSAQSLTTTTTGFSGSATASCSNGTMSLVATAASCQATGPTDADLAIQTSIPPLTYAADAPERLFFEYMNQQRAQCGFGLVAQNTTLDRSAKAHTDYIMERILEGTGNDFSVYQAYLRNPHIEIEGKSGFTGVTVRDRARVAGYAGALNTTENGSIPGFGAVAGKTVGAQGAAITTALAQFASVYHLRDMVGPYREAGVGVTYALNVRGQEGAQGPVYMVSGFGQNPQRTNRLLSYPCQGSVETEWQMGGETPDPLAGLGLARPVGQPVYFQAPRSAALFSLLSASIEPVNAPAGSPSFSTAAANVVVLTQANDPNKRLGKDDIFVIPHKPMLASTQYRVRASLSIDGVVQNVDFTFTTGLGEFAITRDPKYQINTR